MRIADLATGMSRLRDAHDALRRAWAEASESWNDANSRNIEENHLLPLAVELSTAFPSMQQLADVFGQAERACGPT